MQFVGGKMNNYEKIKQMSFDEMLDLFEKHCSCGFCIMSKKKPYEVEINNEQCRKFGNSIKIMPCKAGIKQYFESEEE